jgi:hypothetical protein
MNKSKTQGVCRFAARLSSPLGEDETMGFMAETAILKATEKAHRQQAELLTALLAEQQRTNELLTQLLSSGPQRANQSPSWGRH